MCRQGGGRDVLPHPPPAKTPTTNPLCPNASVDGISFRYIDMHRFAIVRAANLWMDVPEVASLADL